ncbi:hypothetical protein AHAS_Ahas05G0260500 [Arachis hypogaea]
MQNSGSDYNGWCCECCSGDWSSSVLSLKLIMLPYISFIGKRNETTGAVNTWNSKSSDKCPDGQTLGTYGSATVGLILIFSVPPRSNSVVAMPSLLVHYWQRQSFVVVWFCISFQVYINNHGLVKNENLSKTKHVVLRFIILDQQYSKTSSSDLEKSLWNLNPTFCMNQNIESMFGLSDEDIISTFWSRIMREEAKILVEEETTTTTTNTILSGEMEFMYKRLEHEAEEKVQALKEIRETVNYRNHIDGSVKLIGTSLFS